MGNIVSQMKNIYDMMINVRTIYNIPSYQREFVWTPKEVEQLLKDLSDDSAEFTKDSADLQGYLLGNIVLIEKNNNNVDVVDGQQRLTTLSLMGKALYEETLKRILNDPRTWAQYSDLSKCIKITDDVGRNPVIRITHDAGLVFGDYYRRLIFDEVNEYDIRSQYDQNICDVYECIQDYITELDDEKLQRFISIFRTKIMLIVTTAPSEEKAFQLFEILNNRGRSLEPMDLIKNIFLQRVTAYMPQETISTFIENWTAAMKALGNNDRVLSSSTFIKYFILYKYSENITADSSYIYLKTKDLDAPSIVDFATDMKKMAELYASIENKEYSAFVDDQNMSILLDLLGVKQYHALFMLLKEENDNNKKKLVDVLVRHAATFIFSDQRTNNIESILPNAIKNYRDTANNNIDIAFNNLVNEIENDILLKSTTLSGVVEKKNYSNAKGRVTSKAMQLLKFIELYICNNPLVMTPPQGRKLTVEHINSQRINMDGITINDLGFKDENERTSYLHRIGNLTLLFNLENAALGDSQFHNKIQTYTDCSFNITKLIIEQRITQIQTGKERIFTDMINKNFKQYNTHNGQWTKNLIEERSKDIGQLLVNCVRNQLY